MPSITLHFDELNEERRRERRRAFAILALGVVLALLGLGSASTAPPRVIVREVVRPERVEGTGTGDDRHQTADGRQAETPDESRQTADGRETERQAERQTGSEPVVQRVLVEAPAEVVLVAPGRRFGDLRGAGVIEQVGPDSLHLCLSPKWLYLKEASSERVIVSNPGGGPLTVTSVSAVSDRAVSGFTIDDADCQGKTLVPGERCTIEVTLRNRIGETLQLLVAHGDHAESMAIQAPEEDYRLAATTAGFSSRESKNSTMPR